QFELRPDPVQRRSSHLELLGHSGRPDDDRLVGYVHLGVKPSWARVGPYLDRTGSHQVACMEHGSREVDGDATTKPIGSDLFAEIYRCGETRSGGRKGFRTE